ncbi:unnamed protein product [Rotaria sordida]|uniref:Nuclear receptor domain-containing protein n=1 Tax=Rotaria sordida TaxID=392033 RepID=A0A814PBA4_9BILA|nr:unnamed protein product [Rotaria sordida]
MSSKTQCKICEAPALYSYFGVISCDPCKVFFKRNAENKKKLLKCDFDGNCEINLNSRHVCSYCRLMKCFTCGMEIEKLRPSFPNKKKTSRKRKVMTNQMETTSTALVRLNEPEQLPTLNLLQSDQSTLNIDQWTLISNISHCYDEYSGLSMGERFMSEQNALPLELRLKGESLIEFTRMALDGLRLLYEKNKDFISLSFPTINLLRSDQSTLSIDQWNLISNLSHCYDAYSGLSMGERFAREQNARPPKLRLKGTSLIEFTRMALDGLRLLYEKNQDFVSLSADDRSILLQNTFKYTGCLTTNFILYKVGVTDYPTYYNNVEMISNRSLMLVTKRLGTQLNFDVIIMKLLLVIFSFSTMNHTVYSKTSSINLSNMKQILHIQDTYIELIWRYLLYKYNFEHTVKCFSDLLRCLFTVNEMIVKMEGIQWYTDQTDFLVEQINQTLILND